MTTGARPVLSLIWRRMWDDVFVPETSPKTTNSSSCDVGAADPPPFYFHGAIVENSEKGAGAR